MKVWIVTVLLMVAVILLGLNLIRKPSSQAPSPQSSMEPPAPLGLTVESRSAHLRVSWSRDNPHIKAARSGTLTIADGDRRAETVILNTDQLQAGTVLYVPTGNRIRFRLDVDDGQNSSDMVLAILNANGLPDAIADLRPSAAPQSQSQQQPPRSVYTNAPRQARAFVPPTDSREPIRTVQLEPPSVLAASQSADLSRMAQLDRSPAAIPPPAAAPAPVPATPAPTPTPKPTVTPRQVQTVPARVLHEVQPSLPRELRNALITRDTRVEVRVHVDAKGKIDAAEVVSGTSIKFLRDAVIAAARSWSYAPATIDGKPVQSDAMITFFFRK